MVESTVIKLGIVLAILSALISFWQWDRHNAYQGGYNAAKAESLAEYQAANAKASDAIAEAVIERDVWKKKAIDLQKIQPVVVVKYVKEIIEKNPDCAAIDGFSELWNAARGDSGNGSN